MSKSSSAKKSASKAPVKKSNQPPKQDSVKITTEIDTSLEEFFISQLKDMYWSENHLVKALPKMINAAGSEEIINALTNHLEATKEHVARIENIFEILGEKTIAKKCDAMEGLTMSGEHVIENTVAGSEVRDTGIIMSGLKVENFEITAYNGLIKIATSLGKQDVSDLLQQNLDEEVEASDTLNALSDKK